MNKIWSLPEEDASSDQEDGGFNDSVKQMWKTFRGISGSFRYTEDCFTCSKWLNE
jgi:hypothetical protein